MLKGQFVYNFVANYSSCEQELRYHREPQAVLRVDFHYPSNGEPYLNVPLTYETHIVDLYFLKFLCSSNASYY